MPDPVRDPRLIDILPVANTLGEGVFWDSAKRVVCWTDIEKNKAFAYDPSTKQLRQWNTPSRLCCFAPVQGADHWIAAFEEGIAFYEPESARVEWLHKLESDSPGNRMNDGRCDRQGRFWVGSIVESAERSSQKGGLYCYSTRDKCDIKLTGLSISNGLCWSPDSKYMYHTDTPTGRIDKYEFDKTTGNLNSKSVFVETDNGCSPDGSTVDSDGYVWNAQWVGSQVVRYAPDGTTDFVVAIPTQQPTCVAFGGENLNLLFVTTARQDMTFNELSRQEHAGHVFVYETDYTGIPDATFLA
ncbi:MAG: SMP-30/gluconolactonase/LRE family protein [Pseudomonadota bacterium]